LNNFEIEVMFLVDIKDDSMPVQNRRVLGFSVLICVMLVLLFNSDITLSIATEWGSNGAYSHGYLGFMVVLYALGTEHKALSKLVLTPSLVGLAALTLSCLLLLIGNLASVQQLQQLSLFLVLVSIIVTLCGFKVTKALSLPLLMLLLILPVWNLLQLPLRDISTSVSYWGATLLGTDIIRDGYRLTTPGGIFIVEPSCSGLGFFLVSALLAVCVSFFNRLTLKASCQFLLIALAFAIVANFIRIITIVVVGNLTQMQHFIVQDHLTFGWLVFATCLLPLIFIARRYFYEVNSFETKSYETKSYEAKNHEVGIADSVVERAVADSQIQNVIPPFYLRYIGAVVNVLCLFTLANYLIPTRYQADYKFNIPALAQYQLVSSDKRISPNWRPVSNGVSSESFNYFVKGELGFQVYLANYVRQSQAHEMIYVENSLFNKHRWMQDGHTQLPLAQKSHLPRARLISLGRRYNHDRRRLITYWYVIDGQYTADKKIAKLLEVKAAVLGRPGATLVAVALDYTGAEQAVALAALTQFINAFTAIPKPLKDTVIKV
jgi:EpsI family protein